MTLSGMLNGRRKFLIPLLVGFILFIIITVFFYNPINDWTYFLKNLNDVNTRHRITSRFKDNKNRHRILIDDLQSFDKTTSLPVLYVTQATNDVVQETLPPFPSVSSPSGNIVQDANRSVYLRSYGRLGNQLFQYSSLLGIALATGRKPYFVGSEEPFRHMFQNLSCATFIAIFPVQLYKHLVTERAGVFTSFFGAKEQYLLLGYSLQSYKYFWNYSMEIRQELRFSDELLAKALGTLLRLREAMLEKIVQHPETYLWYNGSTVRFRNGTENTSLGMMEYFTFIAIHIRMGDLATQEKKAYGYRVATPSYIRKAMDYYRLKYQHCLFVVGCESPDDIKDLIPSEYSQYAVILEKSQPEFHMAVLSLCNHTIITVGTFSWWVGWLAGGEVVYYANWFTNGSDLSTQYNVDDYFPPEWISTGD